MNMFCISAASYQLRQRGARAQNQQQTRRDGRWVCAASYQVFERRSGGESARVERLNRSKVGTLAARRGGESAGSSARTRFRHKADRAARCVSMVHRDASRICLSLSFGGVWMGCVRGWRCFRFIIARGGDAHGSFCRVDVACAYAPCALAAKQA